METMSAIGFLLSLASALGVVLLLVTLAILFVIHKIFGLNRVFGAGSS